MDAVPGADGPGGQAGRGYPASALRKSTDSAAIAARCRAGFAGENRRGRDKHLESDTLPPRSISSFGTAIGLHTFPSPLARGEPTHAIKSSDRMRCAQCPSCHPYRCPSVGCKSREPGRPVGKPSLQSAHAELGVPRARHLKSAAGPSMWRPWKTNHPPIAPTLHESCYSPFGCSAVTRRSISPLHSNSYSVADRYLPL